MLHRILAAATMMIDPCTVV